MYLKLFDLKKEKSLGVAKAVYDNMHSTFSSGTSLEAYNFMVPFLSLFYEDDFSIKKYGEIITDCSADGGIDAFYFGKEYVDIFDLKLGGIGEKDLETVKIFFEKYICNGKTSNFIGDEASEDNIKKIYKRGGKKIRFIIGREKLPYSKDELYKKENGKYKNGTEKIRNIIDYLQEKNIEVLFKDAESLFLGSQAREVGLGAEELELERDLFATNKKGCTDIVAKISVHKIFNLLDKYDLKIFNKNVRGYLGKKKFSINVLNTLKANPYQFHLFHNGIIIACRKISPCTPNPTRITIIDPQIVNGAQSVYGLYSEYKNGNLDKKHIKEASLICKIVEADEELTRKICETSNTQNAVKAEDLRSNDDIQVFLEKYIYLISNGRYFYKRKKGGSLDGAILSTKLFQWFYSAVFEKPAAAKNKRSSLFNLVVGEYTKIESSIRNNMDKIWEICEIGLFVDEQIKQEKDKTKKSLLRHMDFHLIAGLFKIKSKKTSDFNKIFLILNKYYRFELKNDKAKILNANKIFTKFPGAWTNLSNNL